MTRKFACIAFVVVTVLLIYPFVSSYRIKTVNGTYLKQQQYKQSIDVAGVVESQKNVNISLSYPVIIKESCVSENNYVNKGQLLFILDTQKMEKYVKQSDFTQYSEVFSSIDKRYLTNASANIYATESGFVRQITGKEGDIVLSGENLCVIESDGSLMLRISVDQQDYAKISVGDIVQFYPATAPEKLCYGTISKKTAVIRKETGLTGSKTVVDIYADIDSDSKSIVQGVQFSGTVSKPEIKTIYTLPYSYIGQDEKGEYVMVFNKGKGEKTYVQTGIETAQGVEIVTAFEKDTVFLHNSYDEGRAIVNLEY